MLQNKTNRTPMNLRMRLFSNGLDRTADSTLLTLGCHGTRLYIARERRGMRANYIKNVTIESGKPVWIRLNWDEDKIRVTVKNESVDIPRAADAPRSGSGLILEPGSLWGRGVENPVEVSQFKVVENPEVTWVPHVEPKTKDRILQIPRFRRNREPRHLLFGANGDVLRGTIQSVDRTNVVFRSRLQEISIPRQMASAAVWLLPPSEEAPGEKVEGEPEAGDEKGEEPAEEKEKAEKAAAAVAAGLLEGGEIKIDGLKMQAIVRAGGNVVVNGANIVVNGGNVVVNRAGEVAKAKTESSGVAIPKLQPDPGYHWLILRNGARLRLRISSFGPNEVEGESDNLGVCRVPADQIYAILTAKPEADLATRTLASYRLKGPVEPIVPTGDESSNPLVGQVAPELELPFLKGGDFNLAEHRGKVVVLDFWASWCAPCVRAMPEMIKVTAGFPEDQLTFVAVNLGEPAQTVEGFLEVQRWNDLTVALDLDRKAATAYGVASIPTTILIGPDGKVAKVLVGEVPTPEMIQDLLP